MMEYKINQIVYNKKQELYGEELYGAWHKVYPYEKFQIVLFYRNGYTQKAELNNIEDKYTISLSIRDLKEDFLTEKQYRKIKLQQLNGL